MPQTLLDTLIAGLDREQRFVRIEGDTLVAYGATVKLAGSQSPAHRLSRGQRAVAEYVLRNPEECAFLPAAELGRRAGVSESTVVRLAAAMGLSGYPVLQEVLQRHVQHKLSLASRVEDLAHQATGTEGIPALVRQADTENIAATFDALPQDDFEKAVDILASARRIYSIGLRTSEALSSFFAVAMRYIGREVEQVSLGVGDYWERLSFVTPEDAVLGISFRNYNRITLGLLKMAHQRSVPSVVITDSALAPPREYANVSLIVQRNLTTLVESSTAPISLLNAIILSVALRNEQRSIEALKQREALWREGEIYSWTPGRSERGAGT